MEQRKVIMQMKKLKCYVMVCAVLLGVWIVSGDVSAATIRQKRTATTENPVFYIDYSQRADGMYDMKVVLDLLSGTKKTSDLKATKGYSLTITTNGTTHFSQNFSFSGNRDDAYPSVSVTKPIAPGTTFSVKVCLYSDAECTTELSGYTFTEESFTVPAAYNVSSDQSKPVALNLNQEVKGPVRVTEKYLYYTFTLTESGDITGTLNNISYWEITNSGGNREDFDNSSEDFTCALKAGTYFLKIGPDDYTTDNEYSFKLSFTPYNWGTVDVQWGVSQFPCTVGDKVPFTITFTKGASGSEIFEILPSSGTKEITSETETTIKGTITGTQVGDHTLTIALDSRDGDYGRKEVKFSYSFKPDLPGYTLTVSNNVATMNIATNNCYVEFYMDGQWKTYKASDYNNCLKFTGLKANTQYKYRTYAIENGYKSNVCENTFYTAHKEKPAIKSIKVTKIKTTKWPKKWVSGYYVGNYWHAGYYVPAHTTTSYKLKVTLKKNPPKGASTYVVINGNYYKVKGKTYTVTGSYEGKPGKKIKVSAQYGRSKSYGSLGKTVTKKIKIK